MKTLIIALALASTPAFAMPSTTNLTCGEAASLVASHGAIVLRTGAHTYDRYVAHQGYCSLGEVARPAWVPTLDSAQCFIGYYCGQDNNGNGGH